MLLTENTPNNTDPSDPQFSVESESMSAPSFGDRIEVWWPIDERFYPGKVSEFSSSTGSHRVDYDDGDKETLV